MEEPTGPIEHPLDKPSTEEERDELNQMLDEAGIPRIEDDEEYTDIIAVDD